MSQRPLILLSNDDGYAAAGIVAMRIALEAFADVIVCAPEINQSATSHSLSLHRSLRLRQVEASVFALDGTPADCVYVALHSNGRILPRKPDIAVSGLNHGLNLGIDVFYSGTVAAAREAALRGIPAVATSADHAADRSAAATLCANIARELWQRSRGKSGPAPFVNVNVPNGNSWQARGTRLGSRLYGDEVIYRNDPRGREYLWIGGAEPRHEPAPGSDTEAYDAGEASITPLSLDLFDMARAALAAEVATAASAASKG